MGVEKTWKLMIITIINSNQIASESADTALGADLCCKSSRKGQVDSGRFNDGVRQISSFTKNARELNAATGHG